jgi:uridine kinase
MSGNIGVKQAERRRRVRIYLSDGRVYAGEKDTPLEKFLYEAFPNRDNPPIAGLVNDQLHELSWPVDCDAKVKPIFLSDSDGIRIYCRGLSFLLIVAANELYPQARLFIDYSVPYGGYFCKVKGRKPFTADELSRIKGRMNKLVEEDLPILREALPIDEARRLFENREGWDKVRLLDGFDKEQLPVYSLNGFRDYFYGYMVPSTGYLKTFALEHLSNGFILRFPRREEPTRLRPPQRFSELRKVFWEYGEWLDRVGVGNVGALNESIRSGGIKRVVLVSEALHEQRIAQIAHTLVKRLNRQHRLILIAGPSSSGKTTFAKRLAIQLLVQGVNPYLLGMDDFFLPRANIDKGADGAHDFDSLSALDLPLFRESLYALLAGEEVTLPHYDFITGRRETGPTMKLGPTQPLLAEGIHGLNPQLIGKIPREKIFKIFVSALTQLNLDSHNRVPTTDTRLIRRIVRDALCRGYSAEEAISIWEGVRRGEKQNIFPYQEQADVMFNSALVYELAVLKPLVEPLLLQVKMAEERVEAERLLAFLRWFEPCAPEVIPKNSILREFIGHSILDELTWHHDFVFRKRKEKNEHRKGEGQSGMD